MSEYTHAVDGGATGSWRTRSSTLRAMSEGERGQCWVALCGERLVAPRAIPASAPTCPGCLGADVWAPCKRCSGSGEAADLSGVCPYCEGLGEVRVR